MELIIKYDELKERLEKLSYDDLEKIKIINDRHKNSRFFRLNEEELKYLLRLILGEDIDISKFNIGNNPEISIEHLQFNMHSVCRIKLNNIIKVISNGNYYYDDFIHWANSYGSYSGGYNNPVETPEYDSEYDDFEEEYDDFEEEYVESEVIELDYDYMEGILRGIIDKNISLSNETTENLTEQIASLILSEFDDFDDIDLSKIDSKDLAKVVKKIRKEFKKNQDENKKEITKLTKIESNEQLNFDERFQATLKHHNLSEKDNFYTKSVSILDDWFEKLNNDNKNRIKDKYDKYKLKYNSSYKPSRGFSFESIDNTKYLEAMKNYGKYVWENAKYGVAGATIGMGIAAVIPASTLVASATGVVTFARLAYSTLKFGNKIYSKIIGQPTKIDEIIATTKDKIKNFEFSRKYITEEDEEIEEKVKFSNTKIYKGVQKINSFLKKPSVQWFINGMALGYRIGDALNLDEKLQKALNSKSKASVTVPNETLNLQTEATESTISSTEPMSTETMPPETTPVETIKPVESTPVKPTVPTDSTNITTDYRWLDIGKEGDKIDLTGLTEGYNDSYAARGAYTGQFEHLNHQSFELVTKYATEANGTFISEIRLPNGSIFEGSNVGELIEMGIDPSKCAANICNSNGNYAWGNLEDVLEALSKGTGKGR